MTGVIALGQSAHYIQAWKIFVTQSASDMSLLSYRKVEIYNYIII
jgi:hypothetical protein